MIFDVHIYNDKYILSLSFDSYDIDPQRVQTVQSWLSQATSSFVDAKVPDHILVWAHSTVKTTICKNLEDPERHFQNYGDYNDPSIPPC